MGYLGREWDQSVFGSWARDIGGQTSSRRISGDPITTSTSAAWFTPNIRHKHDLWPAAQGARGGGKTMDHGDCRYVDREQRSNSFGPCFRSKILNFWLARNLFSILYVSKWKFSLWRFHRPAFMSCPVEIYSSFSFLCQSSVSVSSCPDFPLGLSFLMTLRCPGPGMSCNSRDCES